jgi:hypothetical protein
MHAQVLTTLLSTGIALNRIEEKGSPIHNLYSFLSMGTGSPALQTYLKSAVKDFKGDLTDEQKTVIQAIADQPL